MYPGYPAARCRAICSLWKNGGECALSGPLRHGVSSRLHRERNVVHSAEETASFDLLANDHRLFSSYRTFSAGKVHILQKGLSVRKIGGDDYESGPVRNKRCRSRPVSENRAVPETKSIRGMAFFRFGDVGAGDSVSTGNSPDGIGLYGKVGISAAGVASGCRRGFAVTAMRAMTGHVAGRVGFVLDGCRSMRSEWNDVDEERHENADQGIDHAVHGET